MNLEEQIDDLDPIPAVGHVLREVCRDRDVKTSRVAGYISVRPRVGHVAAYFNREFVDVAVAAHESSVVAARLGSSHVIEKSNVTHYVRVEDVAGHASAVHTEVLRALRWRDQQSGETLSAATGVLEENSYRSTRSDDPTRPFTLVDVGILILEAISVLHARGHQRLRILPGMSGSGLYWRTAVTHAGNFVKDGSTHLEDFGAAFHYTTGSEFEVAGERVEASTTADDLADRILAMLPDPGLGADPDYLAWYRDLIDLVRRQHALPIAYADYFDDEDGWEIGWGSGIRVIAPPTGHEQRGRGSAPAAHADRMAPPAVQGDPASAVAAQISNTHNSVAFELMLENLFLSELLQEMWFARGQLVDVLHSPVDAYGYDLVLQCDGVTRHVQLKTKRLTGKTASYKLSTLLYNQPAACVVVLEWDLLPGTSRLAVTYRWYGGGPHEPIPSLGDKLAKSTKGDSKGVKKEKPLHRVIALGKFSKVSSMAGIAELLFGPLGDSNVT